MWWNRREWEIEKELRFHIENQVEENLSAGMAPGEARRQAILLFGGRTQIREECRELRTLHWLGTLWADVSLGFPGRWRRGGSCTDCSTAQAQRIPGCWAWRSW